MNHTTRCTHPPMVIRYQRHLTSEQQAYLTQQIEHLKPGVSIVLDDGGEVEVIECSWCRRPKPTWRRLIRRRDKA